VQRALGPSCAPTTPAHCLRRRTLPTGHLLRRHQGWQVRGYGLQRARRPPCAGLPGVHPRRRGAGASRAGAGAGGRAAAWGPQSLPAVRLAAAQQRSGRGRQPLAARLRTAPPCIGLKPRSCPPHRRSRDLPAGGGLLQQLHAADRDGLQPRARRRRARALQERRCRSRRPVPRLHQLRAGAAAFFPPGAAGGGPYLGRHAGGAVLWPPLRAPALPLNP
jgi:hypothetical protein